MTAYRELRVVANGDHIDLLEEILFLSEEGLLELKVSSRQYFLHKNLDKIHLKVDRF